MLELTDDTQAGACPGTILYATDVSFLPGYSQLYHTLPLAHHHPLLGRHIRTQATPQRMLFCKHLPLEQALALRESTGSLLTQALWGDLETSYIYEQSDADGKIEHLSSPQPRGHCALIASLRGFAILPFLPPTAS
jgi:hypothetical protein